MSRKQYCTVVITEFYHFYEFLVLSLHKLHCCYRVFLCSTTYCFLYVVEDSGGKGEDGPRSSEHAKEYAQPTKPPKTPRALGLPGKLHDVLFVMCRGIRRDTVTNEARRTVCNVSRNTEGHDVLFVLCRGRWRDTKMNMMEGRGGWEHAMEHAQPTKPLKPPSAAASTTEMPQATPVGA